MRIVPVPGAHVPSSILDRLMYEDIVDTRQYRYIVTERWSEIHYDEYPYIEQYCEPVIERIPTQYIDTPTAQDRNNWEIVANVQYH